MLSRIALLAAGLLLACAAAGAGFAAAGTTPPACPPVTRCIYEPVQITDTTSPGTLHNELVLDDGGRAPVLWVNVGGLEVGGEPVCTTGTDPNLTALACIGGPRGSYGGQPDVALWSAGRWHVLTARDIDWLHARDGGR